LYWLQDTAVNAGVKTHESFKNYLGKVDTGNGIATVPTAFVNADPARQRFRAVQMKTCQTFCIFVL